MEHKRTKQYQCCDVFLYGLFDTVAKKFIDISVDKEKMLNKLLAHTPSCHVSRYVLLHLPSIGCFSLQKEIANDLPF